jgi:colicin import membrane protein
VRQRVQRNWLRPPGTGDTLTCEVQVRLLPDGGIQSVRISRSSGNGAFDRSVEAAVWKSDPLPKPPGVLRELTFIFRPK